MSLRLFESEVLNANLTSIVSNDREVYFKAKDVATALGYSDPRYAVWEHVWSKKKFELGSLQGRVNSPPPNSPRNPVPNGAGGISVSL